MTREDLEQAVLDTLDALDALEKRKRTFMLEYRESRRQLIYDLNRYRAKLRGEDWQMELEDIA